MRSPLLGSIAAVALGAAGQPFEAPGFNVSHALLQHGVDVGALPDLAALAPQSSTPACAVTCRTLQTLYGAGAVDAPGTPAYDAFVGAYWSARQSDARPRCVFRAPAADAVAVLVLLARLTRCPFAVKSGGHAAFAGASGVDAGVTVSLERLGRVALAADRKTAAVQPGNTWRAVYEALGRDGVAAIGGRVANIGVGGLTTGGGISFFSNIHGWACDNVARYDVVTAQGTIVEASPDQNPDLYWALRGGGNNFGIVVDFHLATFELPGGAMWGGSKIYTEDSFPALVEAFTGLIVRSPEDPKAGGWMAFGVANGTRICSTELYYAEPDGQDAAVFDAWRGLPAVSDTTQNRRLANYTAELQASNPYGLRELYASITVRASAELAAAALAIFFDEVPALLGVPGILPVFALQGITPGVLRAMAARGGNPLGLREADGPFLIVQMSPWWERAEDDALVQRTCAAILRRIRDAAADRGLATDYVYMNYAGPFQDVIAGYGAANKARLKDVAALYDPQRVFQTLQPGYFKLDRAPTPGMDEFSL